MPCRCLRDATNTRKHHLVTRDEHGQLLCPGLHSCPLVVAAFVATLLEKFWWLTPKEVLMMRFALFSLLVCAARSELEQNLAFDAASASSTYSAGNLDGSPAFNAQQALSGGSGYWSADHLPEMSRSMSHAATSAPGARAEVTQQGKW